LSSPRIETSLHSRGKCVNKQYLCKDDRLRMAGHKIEKIGKCHLMGAYT